MEKVDGLGGLFFRARDPEGLGRWYRDHLGVSLTPSSYDESPWRQEAGPTAFAPFPETTDYFGDASRTWMVNFRVRSLDRMVAQLRAAGLSVAVDEQSYPNGRFARLHDPEGNPIELWEPVGATSLRERNPSMPARPGSRLTLVPFAACCLLLLAAGDPPAPAPLEESRTTFVSHRKSVAVERFEPRMPGPHPAILILHGVNGIDDRPQTMLRQRARELARAGYVALIPHYFERTGADLKNANRNRRYFQVWMETVRDAVTYASADPAIDRRRIGLLGYSLGAHVAVSESAFDGRISAVVEYAGGILPDLSQQLERTPPILIIHGDADRSVPVAEARKLAALLESRQLPYELSIYKGAGHGLAGDDRNDAWQKTLTFFETHLGGER